jgi:hypothetical protein
VVAGATKCTLPALRAAHWAGLDGECEESELPIAAVGLDDGIELGVDDIGTVGIELGVGPVDFFVKKTEDSSCHRGQVSGSCWGNSKVVVDCTSELASSTRVTRLEM